MTSKISIKNLEDSIMKELLEIHPSKFYSDKIDGSYVFKLCHKGYKFKIYEYYKHPTDPDAPLLWGDTYVLEATKDEDTARLEMLGIHNDIHDLYQKILSHRNQERTKKIN